MNGPHTQNLVRGPIAWNHIAYLADKPVQSVKGLDLRAFINDCLSRSFISPGNPIHHSTKG